MVKRTFGGWVAIFALFTTVQTTQRCSPALRKGKAALWCWGNHVQCWWEFSLALFAHHGGSSSDPILWPDLLFSLRYSRKRFVWRAGRWWPSHPPRNLSLSIGRRPSLPSFHKAERQLIPSPFSLLSSKLPILLPRFIFKRGTERCCDLFQGHSQD